jgi:hypothetical protein
MKTTPALLAVLFALTLALPAHAQQRLSGTWQVEEVGGLEPPKGVELTLTFGREGAATLTYTLPGDAPQSWDYVFTVEDGQVTLEPAKAFGDADTVTYEIRFDAGKLMLLPPKPESDESAENEVSAEDADASEDATEDDATNSAGETGDESDDATSDESAVAEEADDEETPSDEDEEEDTREPVWVLVPVG